MSVNVQPKEYTITKEITSIEIRIISLTINESASINILFYGNGGEYIKNESFTLKNPDYQLWTDDQWLIDYVLNKYDLTII